MITTPESQASNGMTTITRTINYVKDYDTLSEMAANIVRKEIHRSNTTVLGLPTGGTPIGMYEKLVKDKTIDWRFVQTFNLDEYVGIDPNHPESYRNFMARHFHNHVNIPKEYIYFPDANNPEKYDDLIAQRGGIDLLVMGMGTNGHVAFNEPGTDMLSETHITDLKEQTIKDNSRFFNSIDEVPTQAVTMGLRTILGAQKILLLVTGKKKLKVLQKAIWKPDYNIPVSIINNHRKVEILYCD
jgi:glucosamine-6-phosphate deaminase